MADSQTLDALRAHAGARRPRRLRRTAALRDLVRETTLAPDDLVYPFFVVPGDGVRNAIHSMPGIDQISVDALAGEARQLGALGIKAVLLFGIPSAKDPLGLESFAEDGVVQHAIRALKDTSPELVVMTDVCLCEYTDHGHCGLVDDAGEVLNDETLEVLGRIAVSHAEAGADVVAPSGMLDGMVAAIRSRARRRGPRARRDPLLRGQVRVRAVRPVSRGRRGRSPVRRPPQPPDGSRERARGHAGGGARRGAGRGRAPGQARDRVPRRRRTRKRALSGAPARGVQRERRVRDGEGRVPRTAGSTSARSCSSS